MKPARHLLLCTTLVVLIGLAIGGVEASESSGELTSGPPPKEQVRVPEPNTMLFAGIGGFIILLFAVRRK